MKYHQTADNGTIFEIYYIVRVEGIIKGFSQEDYPVIEMPINLCNHSVPDHEQQV